MSVLGIRRLVRRRGRGGGRRRVRLGLGVRGVRGAGRVVGGVRRRLGVGSEFIASGWPWDPEGTH
jgi:hypothetical protein